MKVYAREFAAEIVDIFEDFLDNKGIEIPNEDKEGDEGEAIIYGTDWDSLMYEVIHVLEILCNEAGVEVNTEDWKH